MQATGWKEIYAIWTCQRIQLQIVYIIPIYQQEKARQVSYFKWSEYLNRHYIKEGIQMVKHMKRCLYEFPIIPIVAIYKVTPNLVAENNTEYYLAVLELWNAL